MNNSFKKIFFSNLLVVLVIISNLVGIKYTNFSDLIVSVNFVVFPFIFLCFLLINNYFNKKEAIEAVISSAFIQIVVLLGYVLVTKLGSQNIIPDFANYVNGVFKVDVIYIMINLIALMLSTFVLEYIYEYFRIINYKLLGTTVSILSAIILYGLITIPVINYSFGIDIIIDVIMGHLMMSVLMTILITILFYILKEKEYPYNENKLFIKDINIKTPKEKVDKSIEEVIKIAETNVKRTNARNSKKTPKTKKNGNNASKNLKKKTSDSKKDVKK